MKNYFKKAFGLLCLSFLCVALLLSCSYEDLMETIWGSGNKGNHSIDKWVEDGEEVLIYCSVCDELVHKGKPNYDLNFRLDQENNEYFVVGAGAAAKNEVIIIPSSYNGLPVTKIIYLMPDSWGWDEIVFEESQIKTVYIPPSVEYIGYFDVCDKLENVYISCGVVEIEKEAFGECDSLKNIFVSKSNPNYKFVDGALYTKDGSVLIKYAPQSEKDCFNMPDDVSVINERAFKNASNLKEIKLSNSLEVIESNAFEGCSALESINIPDSVKEIGGGAFADCISIQKAEIGAGVEKIGRLAFYGCQNIEKFTIDSDNPYFAGRDGNIYNKQMTELIQYALGNRRESFSMPIVLKIGEFAFAGASYLKNLVLPNTLTEIQKYAFDDCSSLEVIYFPQSLKKIEEGAFGGTTKTKEIHIEGLRSWFDVELEGSYSSPFRDGADLYINGALIEHLEIPSYISEIPQYAFLDCGSLKSVVIPGSIKKISDCAFFGCTSLEKVVIKSGVENIQGSVFYGCASLKEIDIPNTVTYIDNNAFSDCTSLENITLPDKLSSISDSLFDGCTSLKSITIPASVKEIGFNAFLYCESLEEINYLGSVKEWNAIKKSGRYNANCNAFVVRCTDGVVEISKWQ